MGPGLAAINLGRSAAVDVFDTLGRKPTIDPTKKGKRIKNLKGKITFKDLFFYYPNSPNRPLFHNLNLKSLSINYEVECTKFETEKGLRRFKNINAQSGVSWG